MSQFNLMKSQRFLPLFITQFLGAFNDNVFKNALVILLAFNATLLPTGISEGLAVNISAGLFILPFFLFSSIAGQLADYNEKSKLIRYLKVIELLLVGLCATSLVLQNVYLMWISLFLMGSQSTFFGPIKYSILPQHLKETELVGGNSLIEMGTFVSILLGTMTGGILISMDNGSYYICGILFICSLIGVFSACKIPEALPSTTGKINFNIFKETVEIVKISRKVRSVFLSILGISWFWFLGATLLAQFPMVVKDIFQAHENVVTILLIAFSIGIATGSLICEKLSRNRIEPGLVPFGAIGMTIFGLLLVYSLKLVVNERALLSDVEITVYQFFAMTSSWYVLSSLFVMAIYGGFFTVPLYAMVQSRSEPENRSRTIASNNVLNALFMIISAIYAVVCFKFGLDVIHLILGVIILNALVSIYIFTVIPEFMMRFIAWSLSNFFYRVKEEGMDNIPEEGAAIIVANHVSFIDAVVIFGAVRRPLKFVMYYKIFNIPILNALFRSVGAIPIASKTENEAVFNAAFEKMTKYLNDGELIMLFPEGKITQEEIKGEINEFKPGVLKLIEKNPVNVIPTALSGVYGSMFSRKHKSGRFFPKSFFNRKIYYRVGSPIEADNVTMKVLEKEVIFLRDKD